MLRDALKSLQIERIVTHEVPRSTEGKKVLYSDDETIAGRDEHTFLEEKVRGSLATYGYGVDFDTESESPIPELVGRYLTGEDQDELFIGLSRRCAEHLFSCQHGATSPGHLLVLHCSLNATNSLVIMKLESGTGARFSSIREEGKQVFRMDVVSDLAMTQRTRVYKTALFAEVDSTVTGLVSDLQQGYHPQREVAVYFLERFLGARLQVDPAVATRRFIRAAAEFFNDTLAGTHDCYEGYTALVAEVASSRTSLNVREFAVKNLPVGLRRPFERHLFDAGVPEGPFHKVEHGSGK